MTSEAQRCNYNFSFDVEPGTGKYSCVYDTEEEPQWCDGPGQINCYETVNVRMNCITCSSRYRNKSIEELRYEDYYKRGRKPIIFHRHFGTTIGTFGNFIWQVDSSPAPGTTHTKYKALICKDDSWFLKDVKYISITCMTEYKNKSFEELRSEDYASGVLPWPTFKPFGSTAGFNRRNQLSAPRGFKLFENTQNGFARSNFWDSVMFGSSSNAFNKFGNHPAAFTHTFGVSDALDTTDSFGARNFGDSIPRNPWHNFGIESGPKFGASSLFGAANDSTLNSGAFGASADSLAFGNANSNTVTTFGAAPNVSDSTNTRSVFGGKDSISSAFNSLQLSKQSNNITSGIFGFVPEASSKFGPTSVFGAPSDPNASNSKENSADPIGTKSKNITSGVLPEASRFGFGLTSTSGAQPNDSNSSNAGSDSVFGAPKDPMSSTTFGANIANDANSKSISSGVFGVKPEASRIGSTSTFGAQPNDSNSSNAGSDSVFGAPKDPMSSTAFGANIANDANSKSISSVIFGVTPDASSSKFPTASIFAAPPKGPLNPDIYMSYVRGPSVLKNSDVSDSSKINFLFGVTPKSLTIGHTNNHSDTSYGLPVDKSADNVVAGSAGSSNVSPFGSFGFNAKSFTTVKTTTSNIPFTSMSGVADDGDNGSGKTDGADSTKPVSDDLSGAEQRFKFGKDDSDDDIYSSDLKPTVEDAKDTKNNETAQIDKNIETKPDENRDTTSPDTKDTTSSDPKDTTSSDGKDTTNLDDNHNTRIIDNNNKVHGEKRNLSESDDNNVATVSDSGQEKVDGGKSVASDESSSDEIPDSSRAKRDNDKF